MALMATGNVDLKKLKYRNLIGYLISLLARELIMKMIQLCDGLQVLVFAFIAIGRWILIIGI